MSRFLFVVPPLAGHINPAAAIGAELTTRGHDVAWAGQAAALRPLLPAGSRIYPVVDDGFEERLRGGREPRRPPRGPEALKFVWESFIIPLAQAMLPGVADAITRYGPHVVVADQQAIAGAVAARRAGTVWVTSASTPGELLGPLAARPDTEAWLHERMAAFQLASGISDPVDLRFSGRLVLVFTTAALIGDTSAFGRQYVFTGPVLTPRPGSGSFPWEWLDPGRRHLLVSLGTLSGPEPRFFRTVIDALAGLGGELQAVLAAPPGEQTPPHILLAGQVPQLALLPHMSAVLCHGGHNTVCEALAHGLPLVVTPIRDDQPIIAQQVAAAGAGIRLPFGRLDAARLRGAVQAVLGDPSYRAAAARVRDSFTAAGGAATAADHLEELL
jgi:MGT family glycosyltransferase